MYLVELCCTGNNARSRMAESIGNRLALDEGLEQKIKFISSGILAVPPKIRSYEWVAGVLEHASKIDIIGKQELDQGRYEKDENYQIELLGAANEARYRMMVIEERLAASALRELGLEIPSGRRQTIVRDDVSLMLGMERKHVAYAKRIYRKHKKTTGKSRHPMMMTLNRFTGIEGEIPELLGTIDINPYRELREELFKIMDHVIERLKSGIS